MSVPRTGLSCVLLLLLLPSPTMSASKGPPPVASIGGRAYFSLEDLASGLGGYLLKHRLKRKVELRMRGDRFVFTWLSSVAVVNDVDHRMPRETKLRNGVLHAPAHAFLALLAETLPGHPWIRALKKESTQTAGVTSSLKKDLRQSETARARWILNKVIIDPGHGGKDPGAIGPGKTKEKQITLQVAKRLKAVLERRLRISTMLTREKDTFVSLGQRARMAIETQGKLFVSLHCNASRKRESRGSEVYFLSDAKTKEAAEVARRENAAVLFEGDGSSLEGDLGDEIMNIRFGMLSSTFLRESQEMAALIGSEISSSFRDLEDRGVKQADFYVMRGTMGAMPSVLVEIGFISNPSEEKRLRKGVFQQEMAEAIGRGIAKFKRRYEGQIAESN